MVWPLNLWWVSCLLTCDNLRDSQEWWFTLVRTSRFQVLPILTWRWEPTIVWELAWNSCWFLGWPWYHHPPARNTHQNCLAFVLVCWTPWMHWRWEWMRGWGISLLPNLLRLLCKNEKLQNAHQSSRQILKFKVTIITTHWAFRLQIHNKIYVWPVWFRLSQKTVISIIVVRAWTKLVKHTKLFWPTFSHSTTTTISTTTNIQNQCFLGFSPTWTS